MGGAVTIEKARTTKAMYYRMFPTCSPSRLEWGKKGGGVEKSNGISQNLLQKHIGRNPRFDLKQHWAKT